jgi:hypothetical protein
MRRIVRIGWPTTKQFQEDCTHLGGAGGVSGDGTHGQGRERGDDEGGTHFDGVDLG